MPGDYAVSPFTFDADLALIPELLVDDPKVIDAMQKAGYSLTDQPGIYRRDDGVQVDLLVPEAVGGRLVGERGSAYMAIVLPDRCAVSRARWSAVVR